MNENDFRIYLEKIIPALRQWYQSNKEIKKFFDDETEFMNSFSTPIINTYNADRAHLNPEKMKFFTDIYISICNNSK